MNREMLDALWHMVRMVRTDASLSGVIITGEGEAFMAGADLSHMQERTLDAVVSGMGQVLFGAVAELPVPVVAAVNGWALGGGCELALACDVRYASERAVLGLPEVGLGVLPGAGGTQRLTRLVGPGVALEMILSGRRVDAAEALRIGLVNRVVRPDVLLETAHGFLATVAEKGPLAVRLAKQAVHAYDAGNLQAGLGFERMAQAMLFGTRDRDEGMKAFLEHRRPEFRGC
jgi:enoyl-CoA hydratase/carnithine racemase